MFVLVIQIFTESPKLNELMEPPAAQPISSRMMHTTMTKVGLSHFIHCFLHLMELFIGRNLCHAHCLLMVRVAEGRSSPLCFTILRYSQSCK